MTRKAQKAASTEQLNARRDLSHHFETMRQFRVVSALGSQSAKGEIDASYRDIIDTYFDGHYAHDPVPVLARGQLRKFAQGFATIYGGQDRIDYLTSLRAAATEPQTTAFGGELAPPLFGKGLATRLILDEVSYQEVNRTHATHVRTLDRRSLVVMLQGEWGIDETLTRKLVSTGITAVGLTTSVAVVKGMNLLSRDS